MVVVPISFLVVVAVPAVVLVPVVVFLVSGLPVPEIIIPEAEVLVTLVSVVLPPFRFRLCQGVMSLLPVPVDDQSFDWSSASRTTPTSFLIGSPAITYPKANSGTHTGRARHYSNIAAGCSSSVALM